MKIAVDAMGGDFAPLEIIKGCCLALENNPSLQIVLYGDKNLINPILEKNSFF